MADLRAKALSYLRDGKVTILSARSERPERTARSVGAIVQGFHGEHWVRGELAGWRCTCNGEAPASDCAHIAAVQLITGHPTPARPAPKTTTTSGRA